MRYDVEFNVCKNLSLNLPKTKKRSSGRKNKNRRDDGPVGVVIAYENKTYRN